MATIYVCELTLKESSSTRLDGAVRVCRGLLRAADVVVQADLALADGTSVVREGKTDSQGLARLPYAPGGDLASGEYTLTVTDLRKSGDTYDASKNVVSSASVTVT